MMGNNQIIQSRLFLQYDNIVHGISTKPGSNAPPPYFNNLSFHVGDDKENVKSNRDMFFGALEIDQSNLAIPGQIHSENVKIINNPGFYPETDALITQSENVFLIISTADCHSILINDPAKKIIAAVHSGWRGTQKKILTKTLNIMTDEMGCAKEDMLFFIGPGISSNNFEVGSEVSELFESRFVHSKNGKYFVDLKAHILGQLQGCGIQPGSIDTYPLCTYNEKDLLHSYRRDKEKSGRMFSVIGMKGQPGAAG